jgi:hypothetical protein
MPATAVFVSDMIEVQLVYHYALEPGQSDDVLPRKLRAAIFVAYKNMHNLTSLNGLCRL